MSWFPDIFYADISSTGAEEAFAEILQYPFLWPASKILSFCICLRKKLNDFKNSNPTFWNNVNQTAQRLGVLEHKDESGQWNWSKAFEPEQLDILIAFYNQNGQRKKPTEYKYHQGTDLVVAFRNRHEHQKEMPDRDKELLFGTKNITDQVYVQFWISRFPKLLGFLRLVFNDVVDEDLKPYYSPNLILKKEANRTDVSWFLEKFSAAVTGIKSHGFLVERYKIGSKILEIYQISFDFLHNIVSSVTSATTVHISGSHVSVQWTTTESSLTHFGETSQSCTFVFAYKLLWNEVQQNAITGLGDRVLYFVCDISNISTILQGASSSMKVNVEAFPLVLSEFDKILRQVLNRPVFLWKEKEMVKLGKLMRPSEIEYVIKGKDLNRLLRGTELCMFSKVSLPEVEYVYMPRSLFFYQENQAITVVSQKKFSRDVLKCRDPRQIIFVTGKCGMGKSKTLQSMARNIFPTFRNKFVVLLPVRRLFDGMETSNIPTNPTIGNIIGIFNKILCKTDSERDFINYLFSVQPSVQCINFEIMFDGLDEIPEEFVECMYQIVTLIRDNCPWARLWITSRDHMAEAIQKRFDIKAYNLLPLTEEESRKLTYTYLSILLTEKYGREEFERLKVFCCVHVWNCISSLGTKLIQLADIPLHCEMLANFLACYISHPTQDKSSFRFLEGLTVNQLLPLIYEHVMKQKCEYFLQKINLGGSDVFQNHTRKLHLNDVIRSATVLALECVFGKQVRKSLEFQIIQDPLVKKYVLDQGLVQILDRLVFCHQSICEFIVAEFAIKVLSSEEKYFGVNQMDNNFQELLQSICANKNSNVTILFRWLCFKYSDKVPNSETLAELCKQQRIDVDKQVMVEFVARRLPVHVMMYIMSCECRICTKIKYPFKLES